MDEESTMNAQEDIAALIPHFIFFIIISSIRLKTLRISEVTRGIFPNSPILTSQAHMLANQILTILHYNSINVNAQTV
jgi:hypothetical protein